MNMELFKEMAAKTQGKSLIDACLVEIESLRQQLVSVTKERDEIAAQARMLDRMIDERDEQLASALAACDAKDEALKDYAQFRPTDIAKSALAIKPDASALRQHDEALIERCAEVCEEYQGSSETCAAAIRELKDGL